MNIYGEKVVLRAIEKKDSDMLREMINDPEIEKMIGGKSFPVSKNEQDDWFENLKLNNNILRCIIADKNTPDVGIGTVILSNIDYVNGIAEIHFKLSNSDKVRKKGYGFDAVSAITNYAFDNLRLYCIYANVISYNEPSKKLMKKCGYTFEGTLKDRIYKNGSHWSIDVFSKQNEN